MYRAFGLNCRRNRKVFCWFLFIVNLARVRITKEPHLWVSQWGCFQSSLSEEGRPTLNVDGTVTGPESQTEFKVGREDSAEHQWAYMSVS